METASLLVPAPGPAHPSHKFANMSKSLFGSIKEKFSSSKGASDSKSSERQPRSVDRAPEPTMGANPFLDTPADNPPPYTPTAGLTVDSSARRQNASPSPSLASVTNDEDKYAFLAQFDTIVVVDDSGSMAGALWGEVDAALQAITPICTARDKDGIDLYFLNHRSSFKGVKGKADGGYYNITNAMTVKGIFNSVAPARTTPTGTRLHNILKPYVDSLGRARSVESVKPVNIIVITDGRPTDDPESIIVQQARKLDKLEAPPHQVGIQFFQVGNDRKAREALRELDDELSEQGIRDMVDTVTWDENADADTRTLTAEHILKVVLGAVIRKLDRKQTSSDRRSRT
ncbi:hypothetical protein HJFPF1_06514 [Paramyrothecium foliicola]|nr:hypothetical protein HJFPF1_06514 [Paramyrothecium foliicola]